MALAFSGSRLLHPALCSGDALAVVGSDARPHRIYSLLINKHTQLGIVK